MVQQHFYFGFGLVRSAPTVKVLTLKTPTLDAFTCLLLPKGKDFEDQNLSLLEVKERLLMADIFRELSNDNIHSSLN